MPGEQAFPGAVPASGELAFPRRRRLPLLGYPYLVRIVAGRVESFGRLEQLYDTYGRPVTNFEPGEPGFPQAVPVVLGPRPEAPSRSAASTGSGLVDRLQTLQGLRDSGVLSPEEFQAAKARLLSP